MHVAAWMRGLMLMVGVAAGCDDPGPAPASCEWVTSGYGECSAAGRCGARGGVCCYVRDGEWQTLIVDPGQCDAGVRLVDAREDDAAPTDADVLMP